jgi:hypothetical protein
MNKSLDYLPYIVGIKHFFFFADIFNPNFVAAKSGLKLCFAFNSKVNADGLSNHNGSAVRAMDFCKGRVA